MPAAKEILGRAVTLLLDQSNVRWPLAELNDWLNEGVRAIVLAKPSASPLTTNLTLVKGTLQTLPVTIGQSSTMLLLSVNRNVTALTPEIKHGRAVTLVQRSVMDDQEPDWHDASVQGTQKRVSHYIYDEANPLQFFVSPPNDGNGLVEAVVSVLPAPSVATGAVNVLANYNSQVGLPEPYSVPLLDYVMYRAYMKDDITGQPARAPAHYQQFAAAVGIKVQVERASTPNARPL
jgi:hypothetical protein